MTRSPRTLRASVVLLTALAARAGAQPTEAVWEASSGLTPEQVCPAWTLIDTAVAMKQTAKFLQKMTHRLSGLSARKQLDSSLRADVILVIESIRAEVGALRRRPCDRS